MEAAPLHVKSGRRDAVRNAPSHDGLRARFFTIGESLLTVTDPAGEIIECNPAWERVLGYHPGELGGLNIWSLVPPADQQQRPRVDEQLRTVGTSSPTLHMRSRHNSTHLVRWTLQFDPQAQLCFWVGRDVTEDERLRIELEQRANHDILTGLPNRGALLERLNMRLAAGRRPAVLFCDLDHFKVVNDSLGHQVGDALLTEIAKRIGPVATADGSFFGRLGGDEFVVMIDDATTDRAVTASGAIIDALREPFVVADRWLHVGVSIGITVPLPNGTASATELLSQADTAAYEAKKDRNTWVVFDDELRAAAARRFNVEAGLRKALDENRFEVLFQPIVALPESKMVGAEALVRWRQDDGSLLAPDAFLDVAEETGLLHPIGTMVIENALSVAAQMATMASDFMMSINCTANELTRRGFAEDLAALIRSAGVPPSNILVEITESAVLRTDASVIAILEELRSIGVKIGLDDFGTGFSSLAHLRELPIDLVKIDRSFVGDVVSDPITEAMTGSLIGLCRALDRDVIVEGIETTTQALTIHRMGGSMAQGWRFHKPMPAGQLVAQLVRERPQHRTAA